METICWFCENSGKNGCCWDEKFEPVPGWAAIPSEIRSARDGQKIQSYFVLDCPQYKAPEYLKNAGRIRPPGQMEMTFWTYTGMTKDQIEKFCRDGCDAKIEQNVEGQND